MLLIVFIVSISFVLSISVYDVRLSHLNKDYLVSYLLTYLLTYGVEGLFCHI